ncbi:MAG: restriction endonuclease [Polynucleobacter sp.]|nr:restriction endonuclease [Polynucleobacter sp.]
MSRYYRKSPHETHQNEWNDYKEKLSVIEKKLKGVKNFDFLSENNFEEDPYRDDTCYSSKLFILPKEYQIKPIDNLLDFPELLKKIELPRQPALTLEKSEYPETFFPKENNSFSSNLGSIVLNKLVGFEKKEINAPKLSPYEKIIIERNQIIEHSIEVQKKIDEQWIKFQQKKKSEISDLVQKQKSNEVEQLNNFFKIVNKKFELPSFLRRNFEVFLDLENSIAIVEFNFPDYSKENLIVGWTSKYPYKPKFATQTLKKKLVKQCLQSMMIRAGFLIANYDTKSLFKTIVINVEQYWFDLATGQPRNGFISSLQAGNEYFKNLNLSNLDPDACFKNLKGLITPSMENISPIRPIFTLNKDDERLVDSKDVDSSMEPESNLAAMEWEDFEHLVAQLFEWEFSKNGVEVRVTRASRDRGVDAILFDPDPLKGGKYVIQAKRYTRTVDVSAVRDLYGTVMNEGANRGILITTASYGPDAYEFVKDKPLSLVDGPNLLLMLQKHGKKYKIDLEEARRLNSENQN